MANNRDSELNEVYDAYAGRFTESEITKLKAITRDPKLTKWLISAIGGYGSIAKKRLGSTANLTLNSILERLKPTIEFMKDRKNLIPITQKDYAIKTDYEFPKHVENIIEYKVYSKEKEVIGTIGFVISKNKIGAPQLIMNHIQGPEFSGPKAKEIIAKLNKDLGVPWRNLVIKFLKNYAARNKYKFVYLLPPNFNSICTDRYHREEYKRQLRMYINSALKSGVLPKEIAFSKVPKATGKKVKSSLKKVTKGKSLRELRKINIYKVIK